MNTPFTPPAADAELKNFLYLPEAELAHLASSLGLLLPPQALRRCQEVYRTAVYRNPTPAELHFFDELLRLWRRMPGGLRISGLTDADADSALIWQDVCQKAGELGRAAPHSLPELASLCGEALARAGIRAKQTDFFVGGQAELAAHCNGVAPRLVLPLGGTAAILAGADTAPQRAPQADLLLLYTPQSGQVAREVAQLLVSYRGMGLRPLAFTGDEGILPHLLALEGGLDLDYSLLPGYTPDVGIFTLLRAGRHALLLLAPWESAQRIQHCTPGLCTFGSRNHTSRVTLRAGVHDTLPLSASFLPSLRISTVGTLAPLPHKGGTCTPKVVCGEGHVLAGICTEGDAREALLTAAAALAEAGGRMETVQLGSVLEMPENDGRCTASAEALPLLLGMHRAAAELLLPSSTHRQLTENALTHPRLSLFLLARAGEVPGAERLSALRAAANKGNPAALRSLFFEKNEKK